MFRVWARCEDAAADRRVDADPAGPHQLALDEELFQRRRTGPEDLLDAPAAALAETYRWSSILRRVFDLEVLRVGVAGHVVVAEGVAALDACVGRYRLMRPRRWRRGGVIS